MAAAGPKRNSVAAKAAAPKSGAASQGNGDMDAALTKSVGGRVRIITSGPGSATYEGIVFAACPVTSQIALNTSHLSTSSNGPAEYHIIAASQISNFEILSPKGADRTSAASFADGPLLVSRLDMGALRAREAAAIAKAREHEASRGKGVTKEAQEIFDWFKRTLPTRWNGQTIIVNDAVLVEPPYTVDNCRAHKDSKQAEAQIKRVLEGFYQKRKAAGGSSSAANSGSNSHSNNSAAAGSAVNSGSSTPNAGHGRTVVPALPRKGG